MHIFSAAANLYLVEREGVFQWIFFRHFFRLTGMTRFPVNLQGARVLPGNGYMFGVILNVLCRLTGATRFPVMQGSESFPETVAFYLFIMDHAGCMHPRG